MNFVRIIERESISPEISGNSSRVQLFPSLCRITDLLSISTWIDDLTVMPGFFAGEPRYNTEMTNFSVFLRRYATALLLSCLGLAASAEDTLPSVEIIQVTDFSKLAQMANDQQKLIMLEVSATYCGFCRKLEHEIIKPMLRSGDYDDVLIRKIEIDEHTPLIDFDGNRISPGRMAQHLNIDVTPTIIFLDGQNQEVSGRIVGVNSLDYFGGYVDDAINHGLVAIR